MSVIVPSQGILILVALSEVFARNLVRFRKAKGFSQRDLERITGISYRMISYYETKPNSIPINKLQQLATALDVNVVDFFDPAEQSEFVGVDVRWLKKINGLRQLPEAEQREIARHITSVAEKVRLREQLQDVNRDSS